MPRTAYLLGFWHLLAFYFSAMQKDIRHGGQFSIFSVPINLSQPLSVAECLYYLYPRHYHIYSLLLTVLNPGIAYILFLFASIAFIYFYCSYLLILLMFTFIVLLRVFPLWKILPTLIYLWRDRLFFPCIWLP